MAIRGTQVNDKALQKAVDRIIDREVHKYVSAGLKAMEHLRSGVISSWYHNGKQRDEQLINKYTIYKYHIPHPKNGITTITFYSYVDVDALNGIDAYPKARGWAERHSVDDWTYYGHKAIPPRPALDMPYSPAEYVIRNQWELGILGLPERETKTKTKWENKHFIQRDPMGEMVRKAFNDNNSKRWNDEVRMFLKK